MSSFLKFIEEDIEAKKTLISTMPIKTKRDIKKYNEKIDSIISKYTEYKSSVNKYLNTKSKSFNIKLEEKNLDDLNNKINSLEHVRFILNPLNTYFEKIGFDNLIYEISNYYDFNFNSLNDIINQFLNKFELAGIHLHNKDFDYTCYVHEYMTSFLEVRNKESYDKVFEKFEKIYWLNPEIIGHIELNFRKLIKKYERKFINYIEKVKKEVMLENNIANYEDCLKKLKTLYIELNVTDRENINDIINLAKDGNIDINNYFEDSKVRTTTYTSLTIDPLNFGDKVVMSKFYDILEKLKFNIEEYSNYIKFIPLIESFKKEYASQIPSGDKDPIRINVSKNLKTLESQISEKESKLNKLNKKIFGKLGLFESKIATKLENIEIGKKFVSNILGTLESRNNKDLKQLKIDSVKLAQELYELYKTYDKEYFNEKVLSVLSNSTTVSDLLRLYYSFDYFKKMAIKEVFEITNYDDINNYSESFDLFAMNLTNVIINGVVLFEETNISKVIMNKYRLDNINLNDENLNPDDLTPLLDNINLILRVNVIENSPTTIEKIWFMVQVEKYNRLEEKTE